MGETAKQSQYESLVQTIFQNADYDFVGIALQDPDSLGTIKWRYVRGNISQRYRRIILRSGIGIAGLVIRTGEPFFDNDLGNQPQDLMYMPITVTEKLTSAAAIPLLATDTQTVFGVLLAGYRHGQPVSQETTLELKTYLNRM